MIEDFVPKQPPKLDLGLEGKLQPYQGFVSLILVVVIIVSVLLLFSSDPVKRTAWAVFMLLP